LAEIPDRDFKKGKGQLSKSKNKEGRVSPQIFERIPLLMVLKREGLSLNEKGEEKKKKIEDFPGETLSFGGEGFPLERE